MIIHLENNLKDLLQNWIDISEDMNKNILVDLYEPKLESTLDLNPIEIMMNSVNDVKGSISLLKFEQDDVFEGNSFTFVIWNKIEELVPIKNFIKFDFL